MRTTYSRRIRFEKLESRDMLAVFIPGDYDESGVVDNNDYDEWRSEFGAPPDTLADGNGDGFVNAADYIVWRKNLGRVAPPNAPAEISVAAIGATSIQVDWQSVSSASSYSVERREPIAGTSFTTIVFGLSVTSYTDNTAVAGTLYEYRVVAHNANGSSPASQSAEATAGQANLTAFRPQSLQDPENPVIGPLYGRPTNEELNGYPGGFPKRAVLEQDEFSATLGPGVRINGDFDPVINNISTENDLIEVKIDRLAGQGNLILQRSGALVLYYDYDMQTPVPLADDFRTEPLQFTNNSATVFVEWVPAPHGTNILSLQDATTFATLDSVRFHTFRSLVTVFRGRTQDPRDTDGDGWIGEDRGGGNREGIFDIAQNLYNSGWDVMAFDSTNDSTNTVISVAETEIRSAYQFRLISPLEGGTGYAALGYSWGGGAVRDLIERLDAFDGIPATYAVYLDAVEHGVRSFEAPEDDWPTEALYLLNIWQPNEDTGPFGIDWELGGGPISNPQQMGPLSDLEEIERPNENHSSIDDDPFVQDRIRTRLGENMLR